MTHKNKLTTEELNLIAKALGALAAKDKECDEKKVDIICKLIHHTEL